MLRVQFAKIKNFRKLNPKEEKVDRLNTSFKYKCGLRHGNQLVVIL